jgi:hypothetical protein
MARCTRCITHPTKRKDGVQAVSGLPLLSLEIYLVTPDSEMVISQNMSTTTQALLQPRGRISAYGVVHAKYYRYSISRYFTLPLHCIFVSPFRTKPTESQRKALSPLRGGWRVARADLDVASCSTKHVSRHQAETKPAKPTLMILPLNTAAAVPSAAFRAD